MILESLGVDLFQPLGVGQPRGTKQSTLEAMFLIGSDPDSQGSS